MMNNDEDRISNLPEGVLHHTLSFLDLKQAIQTSVLGTNWRYVWRSLPFLNFDSDEFPGNKILAFELFAYKVLTLRDSCSDIQKFRINCFCHEDFNLDIYPLILKALRHNVQEMCVAYEDDDSIIKFGWQLPNSLFTCKSLTKLEVKIRSYRSFTLSLPDSMSLPNLKTLSFDSVQFEGDDIPTKILASCPVLESLDLKWCEFDQTQINISAFKLKHLVLESLYVYGIELYAPNLISFHCQNESIILEKESNNLLDEKEVLIPTMNFLRALQNVEALTLPNVFLEYMSGARALLERSLPIQFCNLRCLVLGIGLSRGTVNAMAYLFKIAPNIESLYLDMQNYGLDHVEYPYWDEVESDLTKSEFYQKEGKQLHWMMYNLKYVGIKGFQGCIDEVMVVEDLLKNAMVLEKLELYRYNFQLPKTKRWLIKLNKHLLSLPRASQVLKFIRYRIYLEGKF